MSRNLDAVNARSVEQTASSLVIAPSQVKAARVGVVFRVGIVVLLQIFHRPGKICVR